MDEEESRPAYTAARMFAILLRDHNIYAIWAPMTDGHADLMIDCGWLPFEKVLSVYDDGRMIGERITTNFHDPKSFDTVLTRARRMGGRNR
jgi:hypothetical protein